MTDQNATKSETEDHTYDISTVCRLTGLTSANLRIWEKRYQAVEPSRSGSGRRQYSREDLQRLTLLKTLTDLGHSISSSAKLPIAELERRVEESARLDTVVRDEGPEERIRPHACRIGVVGSYIGTILDNGEVMPERAVRVAQYPDLESAEQSDRPAAADLLIIECPALFVDEIPRIENLMAKTKSLHAMVFYSCTQKAVMEAIDRKGGEITAIRFPVSSKELKALCGAAVALANRSASEVLAGAPAPSIAKEGIPERLFSERQLASVSQLSTSVKCECPLQLVSLLQSLNGFEVYSLECESRNAADAEVHDYLHKSAAQARSIVEDALKVLLEFEGMSAEVDLAVDP